MAKEIKNENVESVVEAVSRTEQFFNKNGKVISIVVIALLALGAAFFAWHKFAYQPAKA